MMTDQSSTKTRKARIGHLAYAIPDNILTNEEIEKEFPSWPGEKVFDKIGIASRGIAAKDETAADLAVAAAERLFSENPETDRDEIDLLVFCTQSPDYLLPTSACIIQDRLKLRTSCAAFDFNLGCSGYVYGLAIVKGMLESGLASNALLLTGETYSKWIARDDLSVRTIFGDAGTATLVQTGGSGLIDPFVFGTDGSGARHLIVHAHDVRPRECDPLIGMLPGDRVPEALYMDGPEIYSFTLETVPTAYHTLLKKADLTTDEIDWVVFHQANSFMLSQLRRHCDIPEEKFVVELKNYGNTVSCTIPIALCNLQKTGLLLPGMKVILFGFGVGLSWGGCIVEW